eukprot:358019-Chlamydomonas_euryale.AAC.1
MVAGESGWNTNVQCRVTARTRKTCVEEMGPTPEQQATSLLVKVQYVVASLEACGHRLLLGDGRAEDDDVLQPRAVWAGGGGGAESGRSQSRKASEGRREDRGGRRTGSQVREGRRTEAAAGQDQGRGGGGRIETVPGWN